MFRKNLLSLNLALLSLVSVASAEVAADYFHRGAQKYVFGEKDQAKKEVFDGLQKFPEDEPLRHMSGFFVEKKQPPPQDQQQQKQDQQKKDEKSGEEKKDEQQQQNGQKPDPKDAKKDKPDPKDAKPDENGKPQDPKDGKGDKDAPKPEPMPGHEDKKLSGEVKAAQTPEEQKEEKEAAESLAEQEAAERGEMTEKQARALLESLKGEDEKVRLLDPNERKRAGRVLRDW